MPPTSTKNIADCDSVANVLARKLADARQELVAEFEEHHGLSRQEALDRARELDQPSLAQHIQRQPLRATTWTNLDQLAAVDGSLAIQRWSELVDEAAGELESGHHAAETVESSKRECWERAEFLARRAQLASDWAPQSGMEWALIDAMCQALTMKQYWIKRMIVTDAIETSEISDAPHQTPRVDTFRAIDQAATLIDRFDRLFMRALRQLRDLRRYMPSVVVQHADQVNVGEKQLNVAGAQ